MRCSKCNAENLDRARFCSECGAPVASDAVESAARGAVRLGHFARLPSPLAIPFNLFASEAHPVMRLHRFCDSVEILTRFCAVVALAELRASHVDRPLPDGLLDLFRDHIEHPTFGRWRVMLHALVDHLRDAQGLVVGDLPNFVTQHLLPVMPGGKEATPEECVIELRNRLVHGGAMPREEATRLLKEVWEKKFDELVESMGFLEEVTLLYLGADGTRRLAGAGTSDPLESFDPDRLPKGRVGHVVLLRGSGDRSLDLWPLADFGRAESSSPEGVRRARRETPLLYVRSDETRLLYAALGGDLPMAERGDAVKEFRSLFRLAERTESRDLESEIRAVADTLVGRLEDVRRVKEAVARTHSGILWVDGPAGIGKSVLMARIARDLLGDPRKTCRIAWRFKMSDQARCRRAAFLHHAIERLAEWLGRRDVAPSPAADEMEQQLRDLVDETAALKPPSSHPNAQAPRVIFVLDGLDEIARLDEGFCRLPFALQAANVLWLCAGRPEGAWAERFAAARIFERGLPPMIDADVRAMLLEETGELKYDLLKLDRELPGKAANEAVETVVERANGLPLYVHFVVNDILSGHYRFEDLARRLPPSLEEYFDDLLRRLSIGAVHGLLTPLVVTLAWARAPLDAESLGLLMERRKVVAPGSDLLAEGLKVVRSMVRPSRSTAPGRIRYELYHPAFRDHVRTDRARIIADQNPLARDEFCSLALDWSRIPDDHPARDYALRFGPAHLTEAGRWDDVASLLTDLGFLVSKCKAGMTFDLLDDCRRALRDWPGYDFDLNDSARKAADPVPEPLRRCIQAICDRTPATPDGNEGVERIRELTCEDLLREIEAATQSKVQGGGASLAAAQPAEGPSDPIVSTPERVEHLLRFLLTHRQVVLQRHAFLMPDVAYNSADSGPVAEAADRYLADSPSRKKRPWMKRLNRPTPRRRNVAGPVLDDRQPIVSVSLSPDAQACLTGGYFGKVTLWHIPDARRVMTFGPETQADRLHSVRLAPDARYGFILSSGGHVQTLDLSTARAERSWRPERAYTAGMSVSPDARVLFSAGMDARLRLWDPRTGELIKRFGDVPDSLSAVAVLSVPPLAVLAHRTGRLSCWNLETEDLCGETRGLGLDVCSLAVSRDGSTAAVGTRDGRILTFRLPSLDAIASFGAHLGSVKALAFSSDGRLLVSSGSDAKVRVWDGRTGKALGLFEGHTDSVDAVDLSPNGCVCVSGDFDVTIRCWDVSACAEALQAAKHDAPVRVLAASSDGRRALTAAADATLRTWELPSGRPLACVGMGWGPGWRRPVALSIGDSGSLALCAGPGPDHRGTLQLWDAGGGVLLREIAVEPRQITTVALSEDGKTCAWGGEDGKIKVRDVASDDGPRVLFGHEAAVTDLSFSSGGSRLVSVDSKRRIIVWNLADGSAPARFEGVRARLSPDGAHVAVVHYDASYGPLCVWSVDEKKRKSTLLPIATDTRCLIWTPDGRFILTTIDDHKWLEVYDAMTGWLVAMLPTLTKFSVSAIAAGSTMVLGTYQGDLHVYALADSPGPIAVPGRDEIEALTEKAVADVIRSLQSKGDQGPASAAGEARERNEAAERCRVYYETGNYHLGRSDLWAAIACFQGALDLAERNELTEWVSASAHSLGFALHDVKNYARALDAHRKHLEACRALDRHEEAGKALNNIGFALHHLRRFKEAEEAFRQAIGVYERHAMDLEIANARSNLARTLFDMERTEEALRLHVESIEGFLGRKDRRERNAFHKYSLTLEALGRFDEAAQAMKEAVRLDRVLDLPTLEEDEGRLEDLSHRRAPES